jgi:ABC-type Na+ efflux pump permease subunit
MKDFSRNEERKVLENDLFFNDFMFLFFFFFFNIMKEKCKIKEEVKLEEVIFVEAKNGDSSLISKSMAEEEEKLLNSRIKEVQETVPEEAARLNESQYTRLDDLLTQTQLYSEFLLEQMDQITTVSSQKPFFLMNFVWLVVVFLSIYFFFFALLMI